MKISQLLRVFVVLCTQHTVFSGFLCKFQGLFAVERKALGDRESGIERLPASSLGS